MSSFVPLVFVAWRPPWNCRSSGRTHSAIRRVASAQAPSCRPRITRTGLGVGGDHSAIVSYRGGEMTDASNRGVESAQSKMPERTSGLIEHRRLFVCREQLSRRVLPVSPTPVAHSPTLNQPQSSGCPILRTSGPPVHSLLTTKARVPHPSRFLRRWECRTYPRLKSGAPFMRAFAHGWGLSCKSRTSLTQSPSSGRPRLQPCRFCLEDSQGW